MKEINSQIKKVIVYRNAAKIMRSAKAEIKAGKQVIKLCNLTPNIEQSSLQANLIGKATLLSASVQYSYNDYQELPDKTEKLKESLIETINQIEWLNSEQEIFRGEEDLIHSNQVIINKKEKVTVEDIEKLANFYSKRLLELRKKIHENRLKLRNLEDKKNHIELQVENIQGQPGKQKGEVVLNISANEDTVIDIEFSYLTPTASWTPSYDIRSDGTDNEVELTYKANIIQSTGYDWIDIDLSISTGNPTEHSENPVLFPWYIGFHNPNIRQEPSIKKKAMAADESMMAEEHDENIELRKAQSIPFEVTEIESQMATEFQIETKQDIPSDAKDHVVPISIYNLPVVYKYNIVPKIAQKAFLIANISEYNRYDLLPGETNIFFDGMFIGQVYLDTRSTEDSLFVSMGRDDRVSVQRKLITDKSSRKIISNTRKEIKGYEITIRNNKKQKVDIEIKEQIPISNQRDILVELEETDGAEVKDDTGTLKWEISMDANETKKVHFIYSVKYPKDKIIYGI
jgi:uncharacterized protein (TIGR02231 family)